MADKAKLDPKNHKEQVAAYAAVRPCYETYAKTLERVLNDSCKISFPEAFIQSRAKAISSFAEKAARKFDKYPDAVNQMTDLCGARVIVQTTEQVKAVRKFIETNFEIVDKEDKGLLLSEHEFGYRDMHYIVQLRPDKDQVLGIRPDERAQILDRKAEIQVRTWVQHAWADTLHDRIYKNKLKISSEVKRTGNLLAALMEEGDRNFCQLADELDGLIANYTAVAPRKDVEEEIKIQELTLESELNDRKKPGLALKLARLYAVLGDDGHVVDLLKDHADIKDANQCELLLDLGFSLCQVHRNAPTSAEYRKGCSFLKAALDLCENSEVPFVPHLRKRKSLHARALSRLGWALTPIPGETVQAREYYQRAHGYEPTNPYYLADMLGLEMSCGNRDGLLTNMRTTIKEGIKTSIKHAVSGIELPASYFVAGRLNMLLGRTYDALGRYARGICHCLARIYCVPADIFASETEWLIQSHHGVKIPAEYQYAIDLLRLGQRIQENSQKVESDRRPLKPPVLIVAGAAASMTAEALKRIYPLLLTGLSDFTGTIIAGGTTSGVPGCVGDVTGDLRTKGRKKYILLGYLPDRLPHGTFAHPHYDRCVHLGNDFLPDQILRNWQDILDSGVRPQDVLLLGFGGGPLSSVEYRIALGFGASVGIVTGFEGAGQDLVDDRFWQSEATLFPLPEDATTIRAFVTESDQRFEPAIHEQMAKSFHRQYVENSSGRLPANMRPWPDLEETYRKSNREQAGYSVEILQACGFGVRPAAGTPVLFEGFTEGEVECMAEMEHGRWNVERLRDGWRFGSPRNSDKRIHDCLLPWSALPEKIRDYDRQSVRCFPEILAQAGFEIYRA